MIICVCGKSGSGKTTFARKLQKEMRDAIYINIDEIAHDVLKDKRIVDKMQKEFGEKVLENNEVSRKLLGQIVFHNQDKMQFLKQLTWPYMEKVVDQVITKNNYKPIILDYLFLPETKYFDKSSMRVLLKTPSRVRKERIMNRDMIKEEDFLLREKASPSYQDSVFDIIINNNDDFDKSIKIILQRCNYD